MNNHLIVMAIALLFITCNSAGTGSTVKNDSAMHNNKYVKLPATVSGEGTPLLLLPGGLTGQAGWTPFVEQFSTQHTVINTQLLAVQYGLDNRNLPADYSLTTETHALEATLDSLSITQPVHIVGWSYGAVIALDYALANPDKVKTLTLIEPPAFWVLPPLVLQDSAIREMIQFHNTFKGEITENMLAAFLQDAGMVQPGQTARELPQWNNWVLYRNSLRHLTAIYAHKDAIKRLHQLDIPVLLIQGTGSSENLHQIITVLATELTNAQVLEMPAGHVPHIVSREMFLTELEKFQNRK